MNRHPSPGAADAATEIGQAGLGGGRLGLVGRYALAVNQAGGMALGRPAHSADGDRAVPAGGMWVGSLAGTHSGSGRRGPDPGTARGER